MGGLFPPPAVGNSGPPVGNNFLAFCQVSFAAGVFTVNFAGIQGLTAANFSHIAVGQWRLDATGVVSSGLFAAWSNVPSFNGSSGAPVAGTEVSCVSGGKTMDFYTFHFAAGAWTASDLAILQLLILWR